MYLDSADPAAIAHYLPLGILKGITTNPTLLKKQGSAREAQLAVIATARRYYDNHTIPCQIMGASFKNSAQILRALDAGAHTCTIPPDLLHAMLEQPLVAAAIQAFNADGAA